LRAEESYNVAKTVLKDCQIQEVNDVVSEIYYRIDSYVKIGLFRCQINMTSEDFLNSFSNSGIRDLILLNNDFVGMVVQKIKNDGYNVSLMNFGKPKLLEISWDIPKKRGAKRKEKEMVLAERLI